MSLRSAKAQVDKLDKEIEELERQELEKMSPQGEDESVLEEDEEVEETPEQVVDTEAESSEQEGDTEVEEEDVPKEPQSHVKRKKTSKKEDTYEKRYGDLRRFQQKREKELQDQIDSLKKELEAPRSNKVPTSPEQIKEWAETNPQAAAIIRALAEEKASSVSSTLEDKLAELEKVNFEISRSKEEAKIRGAHPDFDAIKEDDDFHNWAQGQNKRVQDAIYDGSAEDVIWGLDLYKKLTDKTSTKEIAKSVNTKSKTSAPTERKTFLFKESDIQKMSDKEYAKLEDKINEAIASGKFLYDITGAAR